MVRKFRIVFTENDQDERWPFVFDSDHDAVVRITVKANTEAEAIEKANKLVDRKVLKYYSVDSWLS